MMNCMAIDTKIYMCSILVQREMWRRRAEGRRVAFFSGFWLVIGCDLQHAQLVAFDLAPPAAGMMGMMM